MNNVYAIITAAGKGRRFITSAQRKPPKQFLQINRKPVILYSLLSFQKSKFIREILVSAENEYFDNLHKLASQNGITKLKMLVEGGKTRFDSVRNAFKQIAAEDNDFVLIHDAARPNTDVKFINEIITTCRSADGVIPALLVSDTIKKATGNHVSETIERSGLYLAQTPQCFRFGVLKKSYQNIKKKTCFTDESALAENAGFRIRLMTGRRDNIKITTKEDFIMMKKFIRI